MGLPRFVHVDPVKPFQGLIKKDGRIVANVADVGQWRIKVPGWKAAYKGQIVGV
jgi:hypothetical protein